MAKTKAKPQPQPTITHVKVVTAGPVSMKAVREAVEMVAIDIKGWYVGGMICTEVTVKRDANRER